jgi:hypothetical protein
VRGSKKKRVTSLGRYAEWHVTNWNRSIDPDEIGFEPIRTETFCLSRRATIGAPVLEDEFYEELFPTPVLA